MIPKTRYAMDHRLPRMQLILLFLLLSFNALGADPATIISTSFYQDETRNLTYREILELDESGLFEPIQPVANLGYSSDITWVKVVVSNSSSESQNLFLQYLKGLTNYIYLYEQSEDLVVPRVSGYAIPDSQKEAQGNSIYFPVTLPANTTTIFFLKIDTPYSRELDISFVNRFEIQAHERRYNLFVGAIIFSMVIITLYNFFLWTSLRDNLYIHFVLANICDTVAASSQLGVNQYVLNFIPYSSSPFFITLTFALFGIFSVNFVIQFLKLRKNHPVWHWLLMGIILIEILTFIQGTISYYVFSGNYMYVTISKFLLVTATFLASLVSYIKGNKDARFLMIGWMGLWTGIIIKSLSVQALVPSNLFTSNFILVASVFESVLLSFALADRYKRLQDEKLMLELDLQAKEKDLTMLAANNKIRYNERKNFLADINELLRHQSDDLRSKLRALVLNLTQGLGSEEKFIHRSENIDVLNTSFEEKLKSAFPQLSKTEVEMCGYIKLNLSIKEIAEIRRTSEGAIKMARHRLKTKMQLEDQNLDDFIRVEF